MVRLIVAVADGTPFNKNAIKAMLENLPGTEGLTESDPAGASLWCKYKFGHDCTHLCLVGADKVISLSDTGEASLHLAMLLQQQLKMPLIAINPGYPFEVKLSDIRSIEELRSKLH